MNTVGSRFCYGLHLSDRSPFCSASSRIRWNLRPIRFGFSLESIASPGRYVLDPGEAPIRERRSVSANPDLWVHHLQYWTGRFRVSLTFNLGFSTDLFKHLFKSRVEDCTCTGHEASSILYRGWNLRRESQGPWLLRPYVPPSSWMGRC